MRVSILGPLVVADGDEAVAVGGARLRMLLTRLSLDAGRVVPADSLIDALWPEARPADPDNALQSLIARLRQVLAPAAGIGTEPGGYRLDIEPDDVDVLRFERLAREGHRLLAAGESGAAAKPLHEALGLWRGAPLADAAALPFAEPAAARLDELRVAAVEDLADAELASGGDTAGVLVRLDEVLAAHPWRERSHARRVRALAAGGRRAEALAAFEDVRSRLADEFGADPGRELSDAHLAALRDDAPVSAPQRRGNLRAGLTTLIGRADDEAAVGERLADDRLVTLVGPGGAGKTRLATAVGAALTDAVPGGVWLVELAALTDPADVPAAVVDTLGLREVSVRTRAETHEDATSRLVDSLSLHDTVIVLDNCEHVVDAAARLADTLLGRCAGLRILATSRERLGVAGESLFDVRPLEPPEQDASVREAAASPAVQLFAGRAAAVRPGFTVDEHTVEAVVDICRRLDGLPLALELAAARLRSLPLDDLRCRLGERFDLLNRGSRTAPARHRTLHDVVAWSWDLLDDAERRFAARLAVLPATISLEAAERVGATEGTIDVLAGLVDKSLLQALDGPRPRYRMLETIREYALRRLVESGELDDARAAHRAYALDLAERAEPQLRGPGQVSWAARLRDERETLHAALQSAADAGDSATAVRLGAALGLFWTIQFDYGDAVSRLRRVLAEDDGDAPAGARLTATVFYLFNAVHTGAVADVSQSVHAEARAAVAALRTGQGTGDDDGDAAHPAHLLALPLIEIFAGDTAAALAEVDRARTGAEPWAGAMLLLIRAMAVGADGDMEAMCRDLDVAAAEFRECGERWGLTTSLTILAMTMTMFGDARAGEALEESIRLRCELDPGDAAVEQRTWLAQLHAFTGQVELARVELSELVSPSAGIPARYITLSRIVLGDLARHDGDLAEARRQYQAGFEGTRAADDALFDSMLLSAVAHLDLAEGEHDRSRDRVATALDSALEIRDMPLVAVVGVALARLLVETGEPVTGAEVLGAAHLLRGTDDVLNPDVVEVKHRLRTDLGEPELQTAYGRGRRADRDAALDLLTRQARRR
ncbi:putative ATPase [Haloactinopolyspora alba]|uniref:Putative ATPase n=1 Tax=Haloactinopolyspora alba TaxID=648780 RepID=A0A2P8E8T2_9ACTN|nr:BTAD domain-containing putative transcriptional regulator [Haloactinopolyspora alba]PSL05871.1 putative ATPase [Haloactinopolyspora alba]